MLIAGVALRVSNVSVAEKETYSVCALRDGLV